MRDYLLSNENADGYHKRCWWLKWESLKNLFIKKLHSTMLSTSSVAWINFDSSLCTQFYFTQFAINRYFRCNLSNLRYFYITHYAIYCKLYFHVHTYSRPLIRCLIHTICGIKYCWALYDEREELLTKEIAIL